MSVRAYIISFSLPCTYIPEALHLLLLHHHHFFVVYVALALFTDGVRSAGNDCCDEDGMRYILARMHV